MRYSHSVLNLRKLEGANDFGGNFNHLKKHFNLAEADSFSSTLWEEKITKNDVMSYLLQSLSYKHMASTYFP